MEDEKNNQNVDTQTTTDANAQTQNNNNATDTKNEGEKDKKTNASKNKIAQANNDGSITFKNQDELDGFIRRMYARGAESAEKNTSANKETSETTDNKENANQNNNSDDMRFNKYVDSEIKAVMAISNIKPEKLARASRLVDRNKILVNGDVDETKLKEEIEAIKAEWPELTIANISTETKNEEKKGFKFGSAGEQGKEDDKTTKSAPKKKWNRFN